MKTPAYLLALIASLFIITSCSKENEGSGIRYKLQASNQQVITAENSLSSRPMVTINWTSGFANVRAIEFEAENNSGEVKYSSTLATRVDIFDPSAVLGMIPIPPGTYEEVEFKAKLAPVNNEPAFELRGDYNGTTVILRVQHSFDFQTEKENVTITPNNNYTSIINLQLAMLAAEITDAEMTAAERTNGEIIISPTSNRNLYEKIVNNLDDIEDCDFDEDDDDDDDDD